MRQLTGKKQGMKESDRKDEANHPGPESCGGIRKGASEALTGESTGEVLSPEINELRSPTLLSEAEGNTETPDMVRESPDRRGRRPSACVDVSRAGTGRSHSSPQPEDREGERVEKAQSHESAMHGCGKSEVGVVPEKQSNEGPRLQAGPEEIVEERPAAKSNSIPRSTPRTQSRKHSVSPELDRVRQRAKKDSKVKFNALLHHLDMERIRASFERLKVRAAPGVDGLRCRDYRVDLEGNLQGLLDRMHRGRYRAKPSRRVIIPKADGRQRALGVASLEDKILQGATTEVLNAIYEVDFVGFSYGFRPGRGPHNALDALSVGLRSKKTNWVLDADIRGFFDEIDHQWLMKFLQHRIGDQRLLRLIGKWLNAGVLTEGQWRRTSKGTPQGATLSPLLGNVYLHYVFDLWANQWRRRHARGEVIIVRYADDFVVGFEHKNDAVEFLRDLKDRFARFKLELNKEKTRLVEFGRFAKERRKKRGEGKPATFTFLGFTHICGQTRSGHFRVLRLTESKRQKSKLKAIRDEMRRRLHHSVSSQGKWLASVLQGYYRYYSVPGNSQAMCNFRYEVTHAWYRSLRRRSHKTRVIWPRMAHYAEKWLPKPMLYHPYPEQRFFAANDSR